MHQGLPGRVTPALAAAAPTFDDGIRMTRIRDTGSVVVLSIRFRASRILAGSTAYIVEEEKTVLIFDHQGTLIAEYPWPKPGTKYVASGQRRGRKPKGF